MTELPIELIDKIFDYIRTQIGIINKRDYRKKRIIYNQKADKIKNWYKQYKIDKDMPILFLAEVQNFTKWYLIRLFMKFYPREDLYEWPIYCLKNLSLQQCIDKNVNHYKYSRKAYQVFNFMKKISKTDIINTGF